jgi:hypothetical protein
MSLVALALMMALASAQSKQLQRTQWRTDEHHAACAAQLDGKLHHGSLAHPFQVNNASSQLAEYS